MEIARRLQAGPSPGAIQERIARAALDTVPGCEHAAISLVRRGRPITTVGATSSLATEVDAVQYETGQGPCLDAVREAPLYRTGDLATEHRWPEFAARAVERTGVRSMVSFRLFVQAHTLGALNLYSTRRAAFDDHAVAVGAVLAGHAALAVDAAREHERAEHLTEALESNRGTSAWPSASSWPSAGSPARTPSTCWCARRSG